MKKLTLNLMRKAGVFAVMRHLNRGNALIVNYHRFSSNAESQRTFAKDFDEQLEYLTSRYTIVPLSQLIDRLNKDNVEISGSPYAAITIDDGYGDAYNVAYPILNRRNVPAVLYVVSDFIDSRSWVWTDKMRFLVSQASSQTFSVSIANRELSITLNDELSRSAAASNINSLLKTLDDDEKNEMLNSLASLLNVKLPLLPPREYGAVTEKQLREMDANGITIGSHTVTHPILTNINQTKLRFELTESKSQLEEILKHKVEHFCYPNGNYNDMVVGETINAGYQSAVTVDIGLNDMGIDPFRLMRIHTDDSMSHFMQATSGFENLKYRIRNGKVIL